MGNALLRTKDPQTSDMGILPVHMVRDDNDLEYIRLNSFAIPNYEPAHISSVIQETHKPSPSSLGSDEISNVIHPSGFSSVTTRTSCRSAGPVPARTHIVQGVYESSNGKQR